MKLSNGLVKYDFDDATGSLCQIKDLKTGKEYLNDPRGFRLVKLIAPKGEYFSRPLYSHLAGAPRMEKNGDTLTISFPQVRDGGTATGIRMKVKVRLPSGSPEAIFTLELHNDGPDTVQEAWFPWVGGHAMKPGGKPERITTSQFADTDFAGRFPRSRTLTFGRTNQRLGLGGACLLPMMDISDAKGGLSYIRYESKHDYNAIVFENESNDYANVCLTWAWASRPFLKTGQCWTSAEFGVGVHQGDWHATADRLRKYVEKWWKPSGMPHSLREKIGLYHVQFHGLGNCAPYNKFESLPDMARDCLKYGVSDICMWDFFSSVYLRPPEDQGGFFEMAPGRLASLKRALAESRQLGCFVGAWVNFRLITECTRLWKELEPSVKRSVYGKPCNESYPGSWDHATLSTKLFERQGHTLCQASDGFRKFALDLVERTMGLGFSTLFIDQSHNTESCLAENHGHKTPGEAMARSYAWFGEATRRAREFCPEAYSVGENCDLYNTQHIDLWWDWGWGKNLQVFRYLIPEMLPCWIINENERNVLSKAFAMGALMGVSTRDMTGRLSDEPALAQHIARLAKLRKATAPFVSHGRFLDNQGLSVENGEAYVFSSDAGLAVTMATGKATQKTLKITLVPEEAGFVPTGKGLLHSEGAKPVPISPTRRGGKWSVEVKVPAYGAAIWTIEREKKEETGNTSKPKGGNQICLLDSSKTST